MTYVQDAVKEIEEQLGEFPDFNGDNVEQFKEACTKILNIEPGDEMLSFLQVLTSIVDVQHSKVTSLLITDFMLVHFGYMLRTKEEERARVE